MEEKERTPQGGRAVLADGRRNLRGNPGGGNGFTFRRKGGKSFWDTVLWGGGIGKTDQKLWFLDGCTNQIKNGGSWERGRLDGAPE